MKLGGIKIRRVIKIYFPCGVNSNYVCVLPFKRLLYGRGLLHNRRFDVILTVHRR